MASFPFSSPSLYPRLLSFHLVMCLYSVAIQSIVVVLHCAYWRDMTDWLMRWLFRRGLFIILFGVKVLHDFTLYSQMPGWHLQTRGRTYSVDIASLNNVKISRRGWTDLVSDSEQHTLAVRGVTFLKTTANGKTAISEVETLWEKWDKGN
jgi:hypothetical protein